MHGTVVGVLRGGPSGEHDVSLKSGAAVIAGLAPERFTVRDVYIDRTGAWHDRGRVVTPDRALRQMDIAFVALHGEYGEDGEVQKLLDRFGVPHTGSKSFGSFVAMHKLMSKMKAKEAGLITPAFMHVAPDASLEAAASEIIHTFHQPVIVKPVSSGSSVGVSLVGGYAQVLAALSALSGKGVLVEEYIRGTEASVGVVEKMRDEPLYALPAVEIIPPQGDFFSYDAKYSGKTTETVPGNFSRVVAEELSRAAKLMHRTLGLRHYSRSDFIVSPRGVYYLETNSLPGLTSESLLPKALAAVGIPFADFLSHVVGLART